MMVLVVESDDECFRRPGVNWCRLLMESGELCEKLGLDYHLMGEYGGQNGTYLGALLFENC